MTRQGPRSPAVWLAALALAACAKPPAPVVDVKGACSDVYTAQVCTFAKTQGEHTMEVGVVIPIAAIEKAPLDAPMLWPPVPAATLDVPAAAQAGSGFNNFTFYWEAGGHPPVPFLTPHFDFHFYLVPNAERVAIDCKDTTKPTAIAASYALPDIPLPPDMAKMMGVPVLVALCVPQMGMHSLPAADMEGTAPFKGDMVVGYYHGKAIFIEPMISKAMMLEKKSFDLPVPVIPGVTGMAPSKFHAEFDAAAQAYTFTFSGFSAAAKT
jgi:hypothetical protein